jgi:hypothetical protein
MQEVRIDDTALARRLRLVREELYGDGGVPHLAGALGIPARTWENYEAAVKMPAGLLLAFIAVTGVRQGWLLTGKGSRYDRGGFSRPADAGKRIGKVNLNNLN